MTAANDNAGVVNIDKNFGFQPSPKSMLLANICQEKNIKNFILIADTDDESFIASSIDSLDDISYRLFKETIALLGKKDPPI